MSGITSIFSPAPPLDIHSYVEPSWLSSFGKTAVDFGKQLLQPSVLVPALAAGAGYMMQRSALRDAQRQANELAAAAEAENRALTMRAQQMAEQRAAERLAAMEPYQPPTALRPLLETQIEEGLRSTERAVTPSLPARVGRLPAEYHQALGETAKTEAARREQLRKLFARMMAPAQAEALQRIEDARFASDVDALGQQQEMLAGKNRQRLAQVSPSGGRMLVGGLLGQAGAAFARNALLR